MTRLSQLIKGRNLPNKGDEFLDLLNHPLVDSIMPWFLGNAFVVHTMSANIARRANSGIYMHRDQMGLMPETLQHAYLLNAMWYLVDVTDERGATRVYPGSHDKNVSPSTFTEIVCHILLGLLRFISHTYYPSLTHHREVPFLPPHQPGLFCFWIVARGTQPG